MSCRFLDGRRWPPAIPVSASGVDAGVTDRPAGGTPPPIAGERLGEGDALVRRRERSLAHDRAFPAASGRESRFRRWEGGHPARTVLGPRGASRRSPTPLLPVWPAALPGAREMGKDGREGAPPRPWACTSRCLQRTGSQALGRPAGERHRGSARRTAHSRTNILSAPGS
ncbi:hypothetical protein GCM10027294_23300 [Marinactinospora endophytica]